MFVLSKAFTHYIISYAFVWPTKANETINEKTGYFSMVIIVIINACDWVKFKKKMLWWSAKDDEQCKKKKKKKQSSFVQQGFQKLQKNVNYL